MYQIYSTEEHRMKKRLLTLLLAALMVIATLFVLVLSSSGDNTYIDLTTITPYDVSVGWGNLTLNKGLDGQSLDMANENGTTTVYEKGFTAHASSSMSFKIEGLGVSMQALSTPPIMQPPPPPLLCFWSMPTTSWYTRPAL